MAVMAANIRSYAENMFDDASVSVFSEDTEYPAGNLQHTHRTLRWHSTSLAEQYIRFDAGVGGQIAGYIAVVNPNITSGNLIVRATNNADYVSDLLLDELITVSPKVFGYGQGLYGKHGYGGTLLTTEMERYAPGGRILIHHFSAGLVGARYWSLIIPASCGSEDAYYAIGRIFSGYEPADNLIYGYTLRPVDASRVYESEGGQPWLDIHPKRREIEISFDFIKKTEIHYNMFDLMYYYGRRRDIIVSVYPEGSEEEKLFNTIYGRFVNHPGIVRQYCDVWSSAGSIIFRESL
jgi:hypothetical protein